jgi:hypothetical protein
MKKTIIVLVVVLILVLAGAGAGAGYFILQGKLNTSQSELQAARDTIGGQNSQLDQKAAEIRALQSQIETQNQNLSGLESQLNLKELDLQAAGKNLTATASLLDQVQADKDSLTVQMNNYKDGFNNTKLQLQTATADLEDAQTRIAELDEKIELMQDTFGDVSAGILPDDTITSGTVKNADRDYNLTRNATAVNPTWNQLVTFLQTDYTDQNPYIYGVYTCGNYAEDVFNHAQAAGIRAAVVSIYFENSWDGHALNAFKTIDRGLVYIDCTGDTGEGYRPRMVTQADLKIGEAYNRHFIFPGGYYFDPSDTVEYISIYW